MMDILNRFLDLLWYGLATPVVAGVSDLLQLVLVSPLAALGLPVAGHLMLLAMLLACGSMTVRRLLRVDDKLTSFNTAFAAKRAEQQQLQLIADRRSRNAFYRCTDEELNQEYNNFLAHHYARYVLIYLLPLFLSLAWLNRIFTDSRLASDNGVPYAVALPQDWFGIAGLGVNAVFLASYLLWLVIGFRILRWRQRRLGA